MSEEGVEERLKKRLVNLDLPDINFESFLGLGIESVIIAVIAGTIFGFATGIYPIIARFIPFLPSTNILLFFAFAVPLTGSTHFEPRLGVLSSSIILIVAHATQLNFGLTILTQEFFVLAGVWSITQIFLIGYLPGKIISTSESLGLLFKGIFKITLLYSAAEYIVWFIGGRLLLSTDLLLTFPLYSIPLLMVVSTATAFLFTNTVCPYMMMPIISSAISGRRSCGTGNHVYKLGRPVEITGVKIKNAQRKGFRVISKLPSVTVFSCPSGGVISVYNSGDMLIRKVNSGTADRINRHLGSIMVDDN